MKYLSLILCLTFLICNSFPVSEGAETHQKTVLDIGASGDGTTDDTDAVRKARGYIQDKKGSSKGPFDQLPPCPSLVQLGGVPQARSRWAHRLRSNDSRRLGVHRDPGNYPGDIRDLRGTCSPTLQRGPFWKTCHHRWLRWNGRCTAVGCDHGKGCGYCHRR